MELEKRALRASPAAPADERAASRVAPPDLAPDGGRNMPRPVVRARRLPRRADRAAAPALEIVKQQRQRAVDDRCQVAVGKGMSHERLDALQLFVRLARNRQLQFVALRCERRDRWYRRRRRPHLFSYQPFSLLRNSNNNKQLLLSKSLSSNLKPPLIIL